MMTATRPRRHDEDGSVSVLVVGVVFALIMVGGLVFDGGNLIAGHRKADGEAAGAARAAAQQVTPAGLHTVIATINQTAAQAAVDAYLAPTGDHGVAVVNGDKVTVTVTVGVPIQILSAVGVGPKSVTGTATAVGVVGNQNGAFP